MKYIPVVGPVTMMDPSSKKPIKNPDGTEFTLSLFEYADAAWFNDKSLSEAGPVVLRKWSKIMDAIEAAKVSEAKHIVLEDEHYTMLVAVVKASKGAPGFREHPAGVRLEMQCLCFPETVLDNTKGEKPADLEAAPVNGAAALLPEATAG